MPINVLGAELPHCSHLAEPALNPQSTQKSWCLPLLPRHTHWFSSEDPTPFLSGAHRSLRAQEAPSQLAALPAAVWGGDEHHRKKRIRPLGAQAAPGQLAATHRRKCFGGVWFFFFLELTSLCHLHQEYQAGPDGSKRHCHCRALQGCILPNRSKIKCLRDNPALEWRNLKPNDECFKTLKRC